MLMNFSTQFFLYSKKSHKEIHSSKSLTKNLRQNFKIYYFCDNRVILQFINTRTRKAKKKQKTKTKTKTKNRKRRRK